MDRDGVWNPPELWPEDSPPLPGWTRTDDGRWIEPLPLQPPDLPPGVATTHPNGGGTPTLGYVEYERIQEPTPTHKPTHQRNRAISAAAVAAGAAVALAAVLVTILLLVG